MRTTTCFFSLVACLFLLSLLAGCSETSSGAPYSPSLHIMQAPTAIPSTSLERVNWNSFTYTFSCYANHPVAITLHNGRAHQNGISYSILTPVFGDLTGDGQAEAVIIFQCTAADAAPAQAFVYSGTARHPSLLATLPPDEHAHISLRTASIAHEVLQISGDGYATNDAHCCPSLTVTTRYKWNGTNFSVLNAEASPLAAPRA